MVGKDIDRWNRIKISDPHKHAQLIFDKVQKQLSGGNNGLFNK